MSKHSSQDQKRPVYEDIKIDTAFRKISARSIGFHVWRIQNDHVETLPKEQYGTFYDECAYVVYAASVAGTSCDKNTLSREIKTPGATIERNIHFWLGANIAPERSKAAAYKIIELDLHLDHKTTQFRESQGNEGIRFLSYFKEDGIIVHCGNDPTSTPVEPRLFQIAGNAPQRCVQQRTISWQCFNSGQIMLLQTAGIVFVWIGRVTALADRVFGIGAGKRLKERHGIAELAIVDDGYEQSMGIAQKDVWNGYLNLSKRFVKPMPLIPSAGETLLKLYQCDTVNGVFRVELVKTGALEQADLYGRDSIYIVDYFPRSIWIWIGRSSQKQNRAEAMRHVRGYVIKKGYPASTPVGRVIDGLEPAEFVALFPAWTSADINGNSVKGTVSEKFDALTLIQRPRLAARIQLIDDGCGDITVYQIGLDEVKEIPAKFAKTFYSGHCYVVHYQVACSTEHTNGSLPNSIRNVLYLWCGLNAPPEHRTIGDAFLVELSDHLKRNVVQVRISEGMEPPHFLQIFKGALIVLNAQEACLEQQGVLDIRHYPTSFVLKVVGNTSYSCKAVQVSSKTLYYPEDCYILKAPDNEVWIWCGQYSTGDSREMAKSIASNLGEYNLVMESNETDEFFNSVGEKFLSQLKKTTVAGNIILPPAVGGQTVSQTWDRAVIALYHCLLLPDVGSPTLRQIYGFTQQDLRPDGVFLLDAGSIVYVWIGEQTTPEEKGQGWELAKQLITTHPVQRDPAMPVAIVRQGEEPITFVGFFDTWDNKYYQTCVLYENLRMEIDGAAAGRTGAPIPAARSSVRSDDGSGDDFDRYQKYPLDMLRCGGDATQLPASINPTRKEVHLTHDDFVTVFNMTYHEFEELPKWKQVELKKQRKLF